MLSCKITRSFWSCSSMCMDALQFPNKFRFPNNSNVFCWKQMHPCKTKARHAHECSFWMTCCLLLRFSERQGCYWLLICSILLVIVWFSAEWFPHPTMRFILICKLFKSIGYIVMIEQLYRLVGEIRFSGADNFCVMIFVCSCHELFIGAADGSRTFRRGLLCRASSHLCELGSFDNTLH